MDKKLERLILEKLKDEVLKRDKELRNKEKGSDIKEATKEALAEMTNLSIEEVNQIAAQITAGVIEKDRRRKKNLKIIIVILIITASITGLMILSQKNKLYIEESFDTNTAGWDEYEQFEYKQIIGDGVYRIDNGDEEMCTWDYFDFSFPEKYSVEVVSKWQRGSFQEYGIVLLEESTDYMFFEIRADGAAIVNFKKNSKWDNKMAWKLNIIENAQKQPIKQRIEVGGDFYKYFINDKLFHEGSMQGFNITKAGLMVCKKQDVTFDNMIITDLSTNKVLLNENFDTKDEKWSPISKITKKCYLENGVYYLEHGRDNKCFWSVRPFELPKNYRITLTTQWIEGEHEEYELVLKQDDKNFVAMQLCGDGRARYVTYSKGDYDKLPNFRNTKATSDGTNTNDIIIEVTDGKFKYFVNEQFIDQKDISNYHFFEIGVRICGKQKVGFDKLVIEEL